MGLRAVSTGTPRFETFQPAILNDNLLTENQASVEFSTAGFLAVRTAAIYHDISVSSHLFASLQVATFGFAVGAVGEGFTIAKRAFDSGQQYTFALDLCGDGYVKIQAVAWDGTLWAESSEISLGEWDRYGLTFTAGDTRGYLRVVTTQQGQWVFWADKLQLNTGTSVKSFVMPKVVVPAVKGLVMEEGTENLTIDPLFDTGFGTYWYAVKGPEAWDWVTRGYNGANFKMARCRPHLSEETDVRLIQDITVDDLQVNTYTMAVDVFVSEDYDGIAPRLGFEYPHFGSTGYDITRKGTWQRLKVTGDNESANGPEDRIRLEFKAYTNGVTQGEILYVFPQTEKKAYATRPQLDGTIRESEFASITTTQPEYPFAILSRLKLDHSTQSIGNARWVWNAGVGAGPRLVWSGSYDYTIRFLDVGSSIIDFEFNTEAGHEFRTACLASASDVLCMVYDSSDGTQQTASAGSPDERVKNTNYYIGSCSNFADPLNGLLSGFVILQDATEEDCQEYLDLEPHEVPVWVAERRDRINTYLPLNGSLEIPGMSKTQFRARWS